MVYLQYLHSSGTGVGNKNLNVFEMMLLAGSHKAQVGLEVAM